jgi:hypothetical protein
MRKGRFPLFPATMERHERQQRLTSVVDIASNLLLATHFTRSVWTRAPSAHDAGVELC